MVKIMLCLVIFMNFFGLHINGNTAKSEEPLILKNVISRLQTTGLINSVTIIGVNNLGNRVIAKPVQGADLLSDLRNNSEFGKDMFNSGIGHKGCLVSFRQRKNPSLQITFFHQYDGSYVLELDIDRYGPWWDRPVDIFRHLVEVSTHWSGKKVGKKLKTNQRAIAKILAKESAQLIAQNNK